MGLKHGDSMKDSILEGHNGRIPAPSQCGYPTDHGETGAIREIPDVSKVPWSRVVFATTLDPCVMCGSALKWLWTLGLRRVVVGAGDSSFSGTGKMLEQLDGMTVVRLSNSSSESMMKTFSSHYPWDWAADIGEIPPGNLSMSQSLENFDALVEFSAKVCKEMKPGHEVAVVGPSRDILASAQDERLQSGGNETRSAAMIAMGSAGSQVNLRECVLFFKAPGPNPSVDDFGAVSIGACKLFRPAKVVVTAPPSVELKSSLLDAGIKVLVAPAWPPAMVENYCAISSQRWF